MITNANELTIGCELWYIYGHMDRHACRIIIETPILQHALTSFRYVEITSHSSGNKWTEPMFLGDVGIDKQQNMNRLFETEEQALAFYDSKECAQYRYRSAQYYTADDFDDYEYGD